MDSVLNTVEDIISDNKDAKRLEQVKKDISSLESKRKKLTDMLLEDTITKPAYDEKYDEFTNKITKLVDEKEVLLESVKEQKNIGKRMSELRLALQKEDVLDEFDRTVFESIVEKVIVGAEDEEGNIDPFKLTFVFKGNGSKSLDDVKERYKNLTREVG